MKKIFILPILIMPIMANAGLGTVSITDDDRVYPVTASYVKEAYNDMGTAVDDEFNRRYVQALTTWDSSNTTQVEIKRRSMHGGG